MSASIWFLALMDMLKVEALVSFLMLALGRGFPLGGAVIVYMGGFALSLWLRRRRLRVFVHVALYALGLGIAAIVMEAVMFNLPLQRGVLGGVLGGVLVRAAGEGPGLFAVVAIAIVAFWFRGIWLAARAKTHAFYVLRFDEGLAVFLSIFLLASFLHVRAAVDEQLVIPYLLFSVIALGLSKSEHAHTGGLAQGATKRILVPVAVVSVLAAIAVVALVPVLTEPARGVAAMLKSGGLTLLQYFAAFLQWLFSGKHALSLNEGGSNANWGLTPSCKEGEQSLFATVMMVVFGVLAVAVAGALLVFLVLWIVRALSAGVGKDEARVGKRAGFWLWLKGVVLAIGRLWGRVRGWFAPGKQKGSEAVRAYLRLCRAGRLAGVGPRRTETPREFGMRLARRFPREAEAVQVILSCLEKEVYGEQRLDARAARELRGRARQVSPVSLAIAAAGLRKASLLERRRSLLNSSRSHS